MVTPRLARTHRSRIDSGSRTDGSHARISRLDGAQIGSQAVVAPHFDDGSRRAGRRHPERVARALHDEHGRGDGLELRKPIGTCSVPPWRPQREREAEHTRRPDRRRRAARDARARRATAGDEREACERARAELLDDRDPGRVELAGGCGRAPAGDPVGLLDEDDGQARVERSARRCEQVGRFHSAARPVTQDEPADGVRCLVEVRGRRSVRRPELSSSRRVARHARSPRRATAASAGSPASALSPDLRSPDHHVLPERREDVGRGFGANLCEDGLQTRQCWRGRRRAPDVVRARDRGHPPTLHPDNACAQ